MREKDLKFGDIARKLGLDKTWTTAALLGQHPFTAERAEEVQRLLDLPTEAVLQESPTRGCLESTPPTDPTMYRIYEVLQVYGTTIKALIHEEFGDGIMSAVNFSLSVDREDTEQGPRVKITLNGAFLPFRDPAAW
jgi:cyanate lyase